LQDALKQIDVKAASLIAAERVAPEEVTVSYFADVCYIGQSYNLEIPLRLDDKDIAASLYRDFLAAHDRIYGHAVEGPAKIVNIRTIHQAHGSDVLEEMRFVPKTGPVELGRRAIRVADHPEPVTAIIYDRDVMPAGFRFTGPAIIQQSDTTTLVEPEWSGLVDEAGNLVLTRHLSSGADQK
jgi:N-methylhydantoinase A